MSAPLSPAFTLDDPAFIEKMLKARARRLAVARTVAAHEDASGQAVLCFRLTEESYALPLDCLAEVLALGAVSPVPGLPRSLLGVTNVRGEIRPVFNLHAMLGLAEPSAGQRGFVVFLRAPGRPIGLRVDELARIRQLDEASLTLPQESGNGLPQRFIAGISPQTLIVLDAQQILAQDVLRERRLDDRPSQ